MKLGNLVIVVILAIWVIQISCVGPSRFSALRALERMKAEDYFEGEVQIAFANAVAHGHERRMREWLDRGADVNIESREGMRPLFWAISKRSVRGFEFLLENGADPNVRAFRDDREDSGLSLMEVAAIAKDPDYLQLALKHGGDPDTKDVRYGSLIAGGTIIYSAIMNHRSENVRLLIASGASIRHEDGSGYTPLMLAANINQYEIAYMLLECGADPTIRTKWGADLASHMVRFGDRGIPRRGKQRAYYEKVIEELRDRGLLE